MIETKFSWGLAGNQAKDGVVDVVSGNHLPISSFPLVEIEKDAAHSNSNCSSLSSSSSELGSLSSVSSFCKPASQCSSLK